jgi:hypothetical protein
VDRTSFTCLLNHMADFLKDMDKYQMSLALVVTKVELQMRFDHEDKPNMVPDAEMIAQIGQFIAEVKDELIMNDQRFETTPQGKLLNIFLTLKNGKYSKIGIMRRPRRPGPLHNSHHLLETERIYIKKLISNLTYTPVLDDFGWTFSDKCLLFKQHVARQVDRNIYHNLELVFNEIIQNYRKTIESTGIFSPYKFQIPGIRSDMEKLKLELEILIRKIESGNNCHFCFTDILTWINSDEIYIPKALEESLRMQRKYFDFLNCIDKNWPIPGEYLGDYKKYYPTMQKFAEKLKDLLKNVSSFIKKLITITLLSAINTGAQWSKIAFLASKFYNSKS